MQVWLHPARQNHEFLEREGKFPGRLIHLEESLTTPPLCMLHSSWSFYTLKRASASRSLPWAREGRSRWSWIVVFCCWAAPAGVPWDKALGFPMPISCNEITERGNRSKTSNKSRSQQGKHKIKTKSNKSEVDKSYNPIVNQEGKNESQNELISIYSKLNQEMPENWARRHAIIRQCRSNHHKNAKLVFRQGRDECVEKLKIV